MADKIYRPARLFLKKPWQTWLGVRFAGLDLHEIAGPILEGIAGVARDKIGRAGWDEMCSRGLGQDWWILL